MVWKKRFFAIATLVLLVAILSGLMVSPALGQQPERVRVLIGFTHQPGSAEEALVRGVSGTIRYTYHLVPAIAATVPERAIDGLRRNPNVTNVDLDGQVWAIDAELDNAWGVEHIGAGIVHGYNKGTEVTVAIIDSGVNYTHPDLDDNFDPLNRGYDFVQGDNDPMDVYGHGTHVAGTACAEDNDNGIDDSTGKFGVVGVAPECALYSLRVLNDDGVGSWSDIIAAMEWAVHNGMQVANLSLGSSRDPGGTVKAAFDNAEAAGVVIVAAAGNDGKPRGKGNNVIYPAKYDSVIAVAATDSSDERASFSSTGDQVELAAPGVSVFSTWNDSTSPHDPQPVCHTEEGKQACYKYGSGTSMASPHVAGTAALVLAANPDWSNDQVRTQLQTTADDLGDPGRDPQYGFGLVDADEAAPPSLVATGTVAGKVTESDGLTAISGASVVVEGTSLSATTDANGDYSIGNVPEGTYDVSASADGFVSEIKTGVTVTADTTTEVNFALAATPAGTIAGKVTESDGLTAISGASVVVEGTSLSATTDANGDYSIGNVPEGTYDVTASADGFVSETKTGITVTADTTTDVNFALAAATTASTVSVDSITYATEGGRNKDKHLNITVALVDDLGNPVSGASVSIDLYLGESLYASGTGTTGTDGTVTFSAKNAPSGWYSTVVTNVTADGLTWDECTPKNEFCK